MTFGFSQSVCNIIGLRLCCDVSAPPRSKDLIDRLQIPHISISLVVIIESLTVGSVYLATTLTNFACALLFYQPSVHVVLLTKSYVDTINTVCLPCVLQTVSMIQTDTAVVGLKSGVNIALVH